MPKRRSVWLFILLTSLFIVFSSFALFYRFSTPAGMSSPLLSPSFADFMQRIGYASADSVTLMLQGKPFSLHQRDEEGWAPLVKASALNPKVDVLAILLDNGAPINFPNADGLTPLMAALIVGQSFAIVDFLLNKGADVHATDFRGMTPLMIACYAGASVNIIDALIQHGALINARADAGLTPLMLASATNKNPDVLKLLLLKNANKDYRTSDGLSAYDFALKNPALKNQAPLLSFLKP